MHIHTFKRIIELINEESLEVFHKEPLVHTIYLETGIQPTIIEHAMNNLEKVGLLRWPHRQPNILPAILIYAKCGHGSRLEALALYESLLLHFQNFLHPHHLQIERLPVFWQRLLNNTVLTEDPELQKLMEQIYEESKHAIISDTLCVLYTKRIMDFSDQIEYKNQNRKMISFEHADFILEQLPQHGIPENRDLSKNLQVFYKDTQMHEFAKTCPICGITLPRILIASHIKPFRDCAHIYEAATHENGLLLCRNHDYLFDQGYISFEDDGTLMVSPQLPDNRRESYCLHSIDARYMTAHRRQFMAYHRQHIYKK